MAAKAAAVSFKSRIIVVFRLWSLTTDNTQEIGHLTIGLGLRFANVNSC